MTTIGETRLSIAQLLARRLLWNRNVTDRYGPQQPVVVLLGPEGSGKTTAVSSIMRDFGFSVVNALFDFDHAESVTTVAALADIALEFSREWHNRPSARFTRFTLGLIAIQATLEGVDRRQLKSDLDRILDGFFHTRTVEQLDNLAIGLADAAAAANLLTDPVAQTVKRVLPPLFRAIGRRAFRRAEKWHSDIPGAGGPSWKDALLDLNKLAHDGHQAAVTAWLAAAFLADVRADHPRLARPEPDSPCDICYDRAPHVHNWVLALDNIDTASGLEFLSDLLAAREQHLVGNPRDHDPLLIIATSGRWQESWEPDWCPPWTSPEPNRPVRMVPRCRDASYADWDTHEPPERLRPWYFPVRLERLPTENAILRRATGGLPEAIEELKPLLRGSPPVPGARDLLVPPSRGGTDPWLDRLRLILPDHHQSQVKDIEEFVTATPFAIAPWLVPNADRVLTEMRLRLWVTAARIDPWIAETLVSALVSRRASEPSYRTQFELLLKDPATQGDPVRAAYCQLALGQVGDVVSFFESTFRSISHREWRDRLDIVTLAPDDQPRDERSFPLYERLVTQNNAAPSDERSDLWHIVTRIVVGGWLHDRPFSVPDPKLWSAIETAYSDLRGKSPHGDVRALVPRPERM